MQPLLIPDVRREGNYIVVTFTRLHLLKRLHRLLENKNMKVTADSGSVAPTLKMGSEIKTLEQDEKGRWKLYMPRRAEVVLVHNDIEHDCGKV